MPIYEYRCKSCGHCFEDIRSSEEADDTDTCEKCGKPKVERIISAFSCGQASSGAFGSSSSNCGGGGRSIHLRSVKRDRESL